MIMSFSCIDLRMSMNEALVASTINSAFALNIHDQRGSVEVGKCADLLILDSNKYLVYIILKNCFI